MKTKKNIWISVSLLLLWIAGVVIAFLIMAPEDVMGWALLSFYIALPLISILSTAVLRNCSWKVLLIWSLVCGVTGYAVFSLPAGDFNEMLYFLLGFVPALITAAIVIFIRSRHSSH